MNDQIPYQVPILWDIMEEYVDEAEFGLERFHSASVDPEYVLDEVAHGPQEKVLACVDGLVIAGERVIARLLLPELESLDDPELEQDRALAIVFTFLMMGAKDPVRACMASENLVHRSAAIEACGLYPQDDLDPWLHQALRDAQAPRERGAWLEALALRRLETDLWKEALQSEDPFELRGALLAMRYADARGFVSRAEVLAQPRGQASASLRQEALWTALYCGSQRAWPWLVQAAFDPSSLYSEMAMSLVAGLGTPSDLARIEAALQVPELSPAALRALGASGQVRMVEPLLSFAAQDNCEPRQAKLAGEAIAMITGLPLYEDAYFIETPAVDDAEELVPLQEDVSQEALFYDPVEDLPLPNLEAIVAWWQAQPQCGDDTRSLLGREWSPSAVSRGLQDAPMRWRHSVALELAMRTRGLVCVPTMALTMVQQRHMKQIAQLDPRLFTQRVF